MANLTLGIDIALTGTADMLTGTSDICTAGNDLASVEDVDVVRQALILRLNTPKGDLWAHPDYGCDIWDLISEPLSDDWVKQAVNAITECINADARTQAVSVTYDIAYVERTATFKIVYQIVDGRQDNLVWGYATEAVTNSV